MIFLFQENQQICTTQVSGGQQRYIRMLPFIYIGRLCTVLSSVEMPCDLWACCDLDLPFPCIAESVRDGFVTTGRCTRVTPRYTFRLCLPSLPSTLKPAPGCQSIRQRIAHNILSVSEHIVVRLLVCWLSLKLLCSRELERPVMIERRF